MGENLFPPLCQQMTLEHRCLFPSDCQEKGTQSDFGCNLTSGLGCPYTCTQLSSLSHLQMAFSEEPVRTWLEDLGLLGVPPSRQWSWCSQQTRCWGAEGRADAQIFQKGEWKTHVHAGGFDERSVACWGWPTSLPGRSQRCPSKALIKQHILEVDCFLWKNSFLLTVMQRVCAWWWVLVTAESRWLMELTIQVETSLGALRAVRAGKQLECCFRAAPNTFAFPEILGTKAAGLF